jgi:copper transport protein
MVRQLRLVVLAIGVALVWPAAPAAAHVRQIGSDPGEGAVLSRAPRTVTLHFSGPLSPALSSAQLLAPDGRPVRGVRSRVRGSDLVLSLPALARGAYSTIWTAVGSDDPHPVRGALVFRAGPGPAPVAAGAPREAPAPLAVLFRWLDFAALAFVIGVLAVIHFVLRPRLRGTTAAVAAASRGAEARLLHLGVVAAIAALVFGVFALPWHALAVMAWEPATSFQLLGDTRWGALWLAREGLLLILAVTLAAGSGARALLIAVAAVTGLAMVRAAGGHADTVDRAPELAVVALALHILAAGAWVGGLIAFLAGLRFDLWRTPGLGVLWARFGRLAAAAVALLAVTGLYTAGRQVASLDALVSTLYGWSLVAKLGLVAVAGGLGLLTAAAIRPRVTVVAEVAAGLAVLLAAVLMSSAAPARGPEFERASAVPASLSRASGDLVVTLSASPNRPGANAFRVIVGSTRRPDPPPPVRVALSFGGDAPVAMRETAPGRYLLTGDQLSADGRSRIAVLVGRAGEPDAAVDFAWRTKTAQRATVISGRPLEPPLTMLAALLALAVALVVAARLRVPLPAATAARRPS